MRSTDAAHLNGAWRQAGFTMIELIVVMVTVSVLAAYVLPKLTTILAVRQDAWHDELQSALRYAQKGAVARRRLTCVTVSNTSVVITTATANPAASCTAAIVGQDGSATFATSDDPDVVSTVSPSGVIYFQPDGRATASGSASSAAQDRTISVTGNPSITILGATGYVE